MAKIIKYKFLSAKINHGTEEEPIIEQIILEKSMGWNEVNEEIAKAEAYNGEYTIEDAGQPEPTPSGGDSAVWDELDAAYQKGVDSV